MSPCTGCQKPTHGNPSICDTCADERATHGRDKARTRAAEFDTRLTKETNPMTAWTDRAKHYGYTRQTDSRCPRTLVGKRHKELECWCRSTLNDHAATWTRHGHRLVLWEPYQVHPEELARVTAAAEADGIRVHLHGMSPWNPGSTIAVEFVKEVGR